MVEVATVQSLESLFATRDRVKLDKDVAVTVGVDSNMDDLAILFVALSLDFDLKIFDPVVAVVTLLPITLLAVSETKTQGTYSSASKAFSILMHFDAIGLSTTGARGLLMTGWAPCLAGSGLSRRARASMSLLRS